MAEFIPVDPLSEDGSSQLEDTPLSPSTLRISSSPDRSIDVQATDVEEDPDEVEFASGEESSDSEETQSVFLSSPPRHRRDFSNVFMPFTPIEHFQNLAFTIVNPPHLSSQACIRRAISTGAGNPSCHY
ncbi:hypothetical protein D1007_14823 [Hordeum vulgare]|nr:hypothetical protein D1007_14823 [Hordeum vulgare]